MDSPPASPISEEVVVIKVNLMPLKEGAGKPEAGKPDLLQTACVKEQPLLLLALALGAILAPRTSPAVRTSPQTGHAAIFRLCSKFMGVWEDSVVPCWVFLTESVETGGANTASAGMQQETGIGAGFKSQLNTNSCSIFLPLSNIPQFSMFLP